jgi:Transcriptional Coactivator p15 (PC4)
VAGEGRELKRLDTFERNNGQEEIRWSFDEFVADDGTSSKYVHVRKWFKGKDGEWHPTKAGATIRLAELDRVVAALQRVQRARDTKERGSSNEDRRSEPQRRPAQHRERHYGPSADEDDERGLF